MKLKNALLLALAMTACAKESRLADSPSNKENTQPSTLSKPQYIEIRDELLPVNNEPNRYELLLQWKPVRFYEAYSIETALESYDYERQNNKTLESTFKIPMNGGEIRNTRLIGHHQGKNYLLYEKKHRAPKDLLISGNTQLPQGGILTEGRVFVSHGTRLSSNGQSLSIVAAEILVDGEAIVDTLPEAGALPYSSGQSGGRLLLKSALFQGKLKILSRGQNGATGLQGSPGAAGVDGQAGAWGVKKCGKHPNGIKDLERDGEDGQNGGAGGKGSRGAKGGDSALVRVEAKWGSESSIEIFEEPGSGGAGGPGGPGGARGRGGAAGEQTHDLQYCRKGVAGRDGQEGPIGAVGDPGDNGAKLGFCVINANQSIAGDCSKINPSLFKGMKQ